MMRPRKFLLGLGLVVAIVATLGFSRFHAAEVPPTVAALKMDHAALRLRDIGTEIAMLKSPSIVIVGDSITEEAPWPKTVCGQTLVNGGVGTATTARASALVNDLHWLHHYPSLIVIATGMNDSHKGKWNETEFRRDYQSIVGEALTVTPNVMAATVTPVDYSTEVGSVIDPKGRDAVNGTIRGIAGAHQLAVIDTDRLNIPTRDGVHPTSEGGRIFVAPIIAAIKQKLNCD